MKQDKSTRNFLFNCNIITEWYIPLKLVQAVGWTTNFKSHFGIQSSSHFCISGLAKHYKGFSFKHPNARSFWSNDANQIVMLLFYQTLIEPLLFVHLQEYKQIKHDGSVVFTGNLRLSKTPRIWLCTSETNWVFRFQILPQWVVFQTSFIVHFMNELDNVREKLGRWWNLV